MLGYVHLRDGVQDPKKYEAVQNSPVQEDRNQEDCTLVGNFISYVEIIVSF